MLDQSIPLGWLGQLIAFPSVSDTSNEAINDWLAGHLAARDFEVERTEYLDARGVRKFNLVARRDPLPAAASTSGGGLAYFCHTDVVPVTDWTGPGGDPFAAVTDDGRVYGRGACDMKGSLTAMLAAADATGRETQTAPLWVVCTADEEVGFEGAKHLVRNSAAYHRLVQSQPLSIIGEPTSLAVVHAHKGISGFRVTSRGRAAHSGTTDGVNANVAMVPMLVTLWELEQLSRTDPKYRDGRFDPATLSWNFGVSDHCSAINITPGRSVAWVSYRPMPGLSGDALRQRAQRRAEELGLSFESIAGGDPLWADPDGPAIRQMCELAGGEPQTVCYGTDGGVFAGLRHRVVCGPGSIAQAHTAEEWISVEQLRAGTALYARVIQRCCRATDAA